jgi:hypothetical protein
MGLSVQFAIAKIEEQSFVNKKHCSSVNLSPSSIKQPMALIFHLSSKLALVCVSGLLLASLSGCQSTRVRINDCKAGDWGVIGNKDGDQGFDPRYEERRKFCADIDDVKINADSVNNYTAGWEQGNFQYWLRLGTQDGTAAKPISHFTELANSDAIKKNHTPLNQHAYQQGWSAGNAIYWHGIGDQDGLAGHPASTENARANDGQQIGFNRLSYLDGWQTGNQAYWTHLGYLDAHDGRPDTEFKQHALAAQREGVQLREDAYRAAWNLEIIEYWKRLAWDDATQGRDVNTRRADAKNRGLKFSESEYTQMWQQRLQKYWLDVGNEDGYGKPNLLEERMANARKDNVFIIPQTREIYQQAWAEQNLRYCNLDNAFTYGQHNQRMAIDVCSVNQQNKLRYAWESGREYEVVLQKQRYQHDEMQRLADRRSDAENRLGRIEKEMKRDQENKNRILNAETAAIDNKREHEKRELRDFLRRTEREFEDLRQWDFRYEQQLMQIKRDIYLH